MHACKSVPDENVCVHAYIYLYIYIHVHPGMYHGYNAFLHAYIYLYIYVHTRTYIHIYACTVPLRSEMETKRVRLANYTGIHTQIHTYIYIRTYTRMRSASEKRNGNKTSASGELYWHICVNKLPSLEFLEAKQVSMCVCVCLFICVCV